MKTKISMLVWNEFLNDARVLKEAQTLQAAGYQVCVHALHSEGKTKKNEVLDQGIIVKRQARSFTFLDKASNASSRIGVVLRVFSRVLTHVNHCISIVRNKPSVVHAHDVNVLPTAWLAAKICRVPLVYDAHEISTSREGYSSFRNIVARVEKMLMPSAAATITTTETRAKFFARAYGIERPIVLQNRPRILISKEGFNKNRLRNELDLNNFEWPIILYQGGLQQGRGLHKLIQSVELVPDSYFVFIGGGRLTKELTVLSENLGLTERVKFVPTVSLSDLPEYTASADIGVQPIDNTCLNHYSTDSNKLFEYILSEIPVVATDFPEIRKIVNGYEVGETVPDKDVEELANKLNKLVKNSELRSFYKKNTILAADKVSWEEQEYKLVHIYDEVLGL
ncbi:Glycosyl transferase group 1 [Vibrio coralliirubri]|uniref:glycosyltransferase n=1 Tax=Vibrio coralliirubri TaxID=1516159 RepID=UPI0006311B82|nr:glycosyltransferase [Vibrio coralliirubri]CDT77940.1 Glycosyl transferase group 1 [Vibrio coralliirubri]